MCYSAFFSFLFYSFSFFFLFLQMAHWIRTSDPAVILHKARFQFDRRYASPHILKKNALLCLHVSSQQLISEYGHWCMECIRDWNIPPIVQPKRSQLHFLQDYPAFLSFLFDLLSPFSLPDFHPSFLHHFFSYYFSLLIIFSLSY